MTSPDYRALLARRLGLPVPEDWEQDWAWSVADRDLLDTCDQQQGHDNA